MPRWGPVMVPGLDTCPGESCDDPDSKPSPNRFSDTTDSNHPSIKLSGTTGASPCPCESCDGPGIDTCAGGFCGNTNSGLMLWWVLGQFWFRTIP
ncbi:hypothetical protein BASA61_002971 [Batrachochytrium salamandrivorans]|nr:hypothetical protein BASA61_002971 [Batrachochytrium salamandrivorans]